MIGAELSEARAVLGAVMGQVRRSGDLDGHLSLAELAGWIPQGLQAGEVDVGHAGGVEDHCLHRT